jgi:hypothetical protein
MQTPWAILLCKFNDATSEPYPRQRYEELFTTAGAGKFSLVEFFRDMSHGKLDLTGSQVFGWLTLDKKRSDYVGNGKNQQGREELIAWARQAAVNAGIDLSPFFSVVVSMNVPTDLFGGPSGVVCADGRYKENGMSGLSPSLVAQEMGHVYGLNHSRADGSPDDYKDRWDVMSTAGDAFMTPHPNFTELGALGRAVFRVGPGLNAANMWSRDWLDVTRIWTADLEHHGTTIHLRPLHRVDLPGYLVARVGRFFFEFRILELWDAGIYQSAVLVHDFWNGNSYLHTGTGGNQSLRSGDAFQTGDPSDPLGAFLRVTVTNIDPHSRTATLHVIRKRDRHPKTGPALVLEGVSSDGGGYVIVGPKIEKIPPWSPLQAIIDAIAEIQASETVSNGVARDLIQTEAFQRIATLASVQVARTRSFRAPVAPISGPEGDGSESDLTGASTAAIHGQNDL